MEKKKMSQENEKWKEDIRNIVREEMKNALKPIQSPPSSEKQPEAPHGHATVAEQMLCKDCNPPDTYKKAHLELMGLKECQDCGHIDRKGEEYCENCGEEYNREE